MVILPGVFLFPDRQLIHPKWVSKSVAKFNLRAKSIGDLFERRHNLQMILDRDALAKTYSEMSDVELLNLHSEGIISEVAYEVLESQLQERGIHIPKRPPLREELRIATEMLSQHYAKKTDEELRDIVQGDVSPEAAEALNVEFHRRGLAIPGKDFEESARDEPKILSRPTKALSLFLKIYIAIVLVAFLIDLTLWETESSVDAYAYTVFAFVAQLQFGTLMTLYAIFSWWIYSTNNNLRTLSGRPMKYTPIWAVVWFFVPIAFLFKPYHVMKEIWQISHKDELHSNSLLGWWWFLWLTSLFAGRLTNAQPGNVNYIDPIITYLVYDGIMCVLTIVALILVSRINAAYSKNIIETIKPNNE